MELNNPYGAFFLNFDKDVTGIHIMQRPWTIDWASYNETGIGMEAEVVNDFVTGHSVGWLCWLQIVEATFFTRNENFVRTIPELCDASDI